MPPRLGALPAAQMACEIVDEGGRRVLEGCQIDIVRGSISPRRKETVLFEPRESDLLRS